MKVLLIHGVHSMIIVMNMEEIDTVVTNTVQEEEIVVVDIWKVDVLEITEDTKC